MDYSSEEGVLVYNDRSTGRNFLDEKDHLGRTALHMAVLCNKPQIVRGLLDLGADINQEDSKGKRPVDVSVSKAITNLLLARMKSNTMKKFYTRKSTSSPKKL